MKHKHISVLSLAVFGAASAYSQITLNTVPSRVVGADSLTVSSLTPNLVEGREFYLPQAVALDNSVSPPRLYVSDYGNNRILAWKNAASFTNGQKADLVIGQPDLLTTFSEGPGTSQYPSWLTLPSGLAVDSTGNLYVSDTGNNRILRFPTPFAHTQALFPDLAIGQLNSSSGRGTNYPTGITNAQGLSLSANPYGDRLALDSTGNLWVTDTGNARVLEFSLAKLQSGVQGGLAADLVLGQASFTTNTALPSATASLSNLSQFIAPSGLGFDSNGDLFVGDVDRALVFVAPFSNGMSASPKILGWDPNATSPSQTIIDTTSVYAPTAFFFLSNGASGVGVVDGAASRIMIFDTFANWPGARPVSKTILGQQNTCTQYPNGACLYPNNGNLQGASSSTFSAPGGAAYTGTDLYLADTGNNRVIDLPQQGSAASFGAATRVLGQDYFTTNSINLIEDREFQFTGTLPGLSNTFADAAIAIDNRTGTPHLYVSDPYNNRVLGFNDMRKFQNGGTNKADIVLGQSASPATAMINYPSGDPTKPTKSSLYRPVGLLVDTNGNLYVADSLNGRVLRFPAPFAYAGLEASNTTAGATPEQADLVLGQQNFTSNTNNGPFANTMALPYGLAFTPSCISPTQQCAAPNGLLISDQVWNRVLYIPTTNGSFTAGTDNGKAATKVFGQANFSSTGAGSSQSQMFDPHHIACDTNGNCYVADSGNNRVIIFNDPNSATTLTGAAYVGAISTGLNNPQGVYVSPITGEIWVANSGSGTASRFTPFVLNGLSSLNVIPDYGDPTNTSSGLIAPLAVVQDQYGDLIVADEAHRVTIYYPGLNICNGASFFPVSPTSAQNPSANCLTQYDSALKTAGSAGIRQRQLAPGAFATIFPCVNCPADQFLDQSVAFNGNYPVPPSMSDVQVLVAGTPSPLYYVGAPIPPSHPTGQINFVVPNNSALASTSSSVDVEVVQISTGRVLGATLVSMNSVAPAFFLYPQGQTGSTVYAAVINQDNTVNSASNPAIRGQVVSLYMTGQGYVPNAPADGVPAATAIASQYKPTVLLNNLDVNSQYGESFEHILYYGLNAYPGMWQVNVKIPTGITTFPPSIDVIVNNVSAWDLTTDSPYHTYIYVK